MMCPDFFCCKRSAMIVQEILVEESSGLLQSRCIHCSPNISPAKIKKAIQNDIDNSLVAGFNPFEKYATVKLDYISPRIRGENKKYSKPMGIFAGTNTPPPFLFKESATTSHPPHNQGRFPPPRPQMIGPSVVALKVNPPTFGSAVNPPSSCC